MLLLLCETLCNYCLRFFFFFFLILSHKTLGVSPTSNALQYMWPTLTNLLRIHSRPQKIGAKAWLLLLSYKALVFLSCRVVLVL